MRRSAQTFIVAAVSVGIWAGLATAASAQVPIRIGASLSKTGECAELMKEMDEKVAEGVTSKEED